MAQDSPNVNVYLVFNGQCEEAFKFYEKVLSGRTTAIARYSDTPVAEQFPPDWRNKIIHGKIIIGGVALMASDSPPGRYETPQGFSLSFSANGTAEAERIFKALEEKGDVKMPMQKTFFAERFGMVVDRFGIPWMILYQKNP